MIFQRLRISFLFIVYLFAVRFFFLARLCWFSQFVCRKIVKTACIGLCFLHCPKVRQRDRARKRERERARECDNHNGSGWRTRCGLKVKGEAAEQEQEAETARKRKLGQTSPLARSLSRSLAGGAMDEATRRSADWIDPNWRQNNYE